MCGIVDCQRHGSGWVAYKAKHPERAAFYASSTWRFMREQHLKANPFCVVCGERASHADHVLAIANGGTTDGRLQSMCAKHHHEKTVRDNMRPPTGQPRDERRSSDEHDLQSVWPQEEGT